MDDFTSYGTDTNRSARLLDGAYGAVNLFSLQADPDPNSTGAQVLQGTGGGLGGDIRKVLTGPQTTVGMANRLWMTGLPPGPNQGFCFHVYKDVNAHVHIQLQVNPSGYIEAWRNAFTDTGLRTLLGTSTTPVMSANAWRHIESKVVFDATTGGSIEVRVEGIQVLLLTGIKTTSDVVGAAATCSMVGAMSPQDNAGILFYFKDLIVWDGTGTTNNTFMGSCIVYKIIPQSDVTLNWTTSSGLTGYNLINDATPDDDTNYIYAPYPAPSPSTFNLTDLPANVSSVRGVQVMHRSRKADGGDGNVQTTLISGANNAVGADRPITTAYTYWWDIFDKDPSGSSWSRTLVNALQLKLNRTL